MLYAFRDRIFTLRWAALLAAVLLYAFRDRGRLEAALRRRREARRKGGGTGSPSAAARRAALASACPGRSVRGSVIARQF